MNISHTHRKRNQSDLGGGGGGGLDWRKRRGGNERELKVQTTPVV